MSSIIRHDMLVRRALAFVDERRHERPDLPLEALIDEAGQRFNLSPVDSEALAHAFRTAASSAADAARENG